MLLFLVGHKPGLQATAERLSQISIDTGMSDSTGIATVLAGSI